MFGGAKKWSERKIKDKPCKICKIVFSPNCGGNMYCQPCGVVEKRRVRNMHTAKYNARNADIIKDKMRARRLVRELGMTAADFEKMFEENNGRCEICKINLTKRRPHGGGDLSHAVVDHCHKSKAIRGMLCGSCNFAVGFFRDSIENIKSAQRYLEKAKSKKNED